MVVIDLYKAATESEQAGSFSTISSPLKMAILGKGFSPLVTHGGPSQGFGPVEFALSARRCPYLTCALFARLLSVGAAPKFKIFVVMR